MTNAARQLPETFAEGISSRAEAMQILEVLQEMKTLTAACYQHFVPMRLESPIYDISYLANYALTAFISGNAHQQAHDATTLQYLLVNLHKALSVIPDYVDAKVTDLSIKMTHDNILEHDATKTFSQVALTRLESALKKADEVGLFSKLATFDPRAAKPAATAPKAQPARSR